MSKRSKVFKLKSNQDGMALAIALIISTAFILIASSVLYLSVLNSSRTRNQTQLVKDNIITDSATKVALEKVKRYMLSSSLAKFQPNVNFGYNSEQMGKLGTILPDDTDDIIKTKLGLLIDDSGTTPIEKVLSGETFSARKNYYRFNMQTGDKDTEVRYRIIDEPWKLKTMNTSEAIKKLTVYSISNSGSNRWRGIKADVEIVRSNLYNYGVFFNDDLEILPGKNMTFKGKVHTNKNMYLGGTLTFGSATNNKSEITSAGHIYYGRKNQTNTETGTVNIYNRSGTATNFDAKTDSVNTSKTNTFQSHHLEKSDKEFKDNVTPNGTETWKVAKSSDNSSNWNTNTVGGKTWDWKTGATETWDGMVQDSSHGVDPKNPPPVEAIQPEGPYAKKSGLFIKTDLGAPTSSTVTTITGSVKTETITENTIETIEVKAGKEGAVLYKKDIVHTNITVKETKSGKTTVKSNTASSAVNAATFENNLGITPETASGSNPAISEDPFDTLKFSNNREKKQVRNTVIDIASLQKSSYWPSNGLVYATRTDAVASTVEADRNPTGIILENGSKLSKEINFVTNNPVYVRGDFNKHQTADKTPITDTDSALGSSSDMWQPASIISDATTMLSNSWDPNHENYSKGTSSPSVSSDTEYNFTMVTGNVNTKRDSNTEDNYSGGLENFPRFLENWDNKKATFRGSLIQLWQSTYATAPWKNGGYSAPNRDWGYDESFNKRELPENFTEMFPSVAEGIVVQNWRYLDAGDPVLSKTSNLSMID